jgi:hypothetical protein
MRTVDLDFRMVDWSQDPVGSIAYRSGLYAGRYTPGLPKREVSHRDRSLHRRGADIEPRAQTL